MAIDDCFKNVRLKNGIEIVFRAIRHGDKERMHELFDSFSPQTVYFRFFAPIGVMTDEALEHYLDVDFVHAVAIVASVRKGGKEHLIAVARYYADEKKPEMAEYAIVVADDWQGRGVGTKLMKHLCRVAKGRGVKVFHALVFKENGEMFKLLGRLGYPWEKRKFDEDVERVEVYLK